MVSRSRTPPAHQLDRLDVYEVHEEPAEKKALTYSSSSSSLIQIPWEGKTTQLSGVMTLPSRKRKRQTCTERSKREVWELFFGPTASSGDCPVCGCPVTWKRWQAGHMKAFSSGGSSSAENLVVTCGCNQEMSVQHLLDYMGSHAAHRIKRLIVLVTKLFQSRLPKPQRRKWILIHENRVLIEFVKQFYNPPDLSTYQEWLETDSTDLLSLLA